ncbi:MAG: tetratricopeptide repeat protein [Desulfobulbaceae bacterium]|nr:tetratricopeptide repeat protein [Desulfobulbaceae bacterium]
MKKYIYFFSTIFLLSIQLLSSPTSCSANRNTNVPDGPARLLNLAESFLNGKNYTRSEATYKEVLSIDRNNDEAYFKLGIIALRHYHNNNKAIYYFNKAIELNKNGVEYYINRGAAYAAIDDWKLAIVDYTTALQIDPKNTWALSSRARSYEENKDADNAISDYQAAKLIDPLNHATYNIEIARVSLKLGAEIKKTKENSGVFLERAIQELNRGEHIERAEEDLKTTIELDSKNDWAHFLLGKIYATSPDKSKPAMKQFSKAIKINKLVPDYYFFRGKLHGKNGNYKAAKKDFDAAIELDPRRGNLYFYRGMCYMELEMTTEAQDDLIKFKQLDPKRGTQADSYLNTLFSQKKSSK